MKVYSIAIRHYRNIENATVTFDPNVTCLIGNNAQGKTNVMEAVYYFARGKSFRGAADADLLKFGEKQFSLSLSYGKKERDETLFYAYSEVYGKERLRKKNGVVLHKQSDLPGNFRAVLFCPDHLQMIKGTPGERRKFLDVALSQIYPVYIGLYARYNKTLQNRSALLKAFQKGESRDERELLVYSEAIASLASEIYLYRKKYAGRLLEKAGAVLADLTRGKEVLSLSYKGDIDPETTDPQEIKRQYNEVFTQNVKKEIAAGMTLYGIHRDDLILSVNGISAKEYGSQGQQRSLVLAMKMAEGYLSAEETGETPVYLLDDVLSELDEDRRAFLFSGIRDAQVIVSGCEKEYLLQSIQKMGQERNIKVIEVKDGTYSSSEP
ncbi:MAG: DNA replication/repair protein RecF [Clostridia bacterium]|nr:DNA replication/repair protein RecF [Clostridia bacterium]